MYMRAAMVASCCVWEVSEGCNRQVNAPLKTSKLMETTID